MAYRKEDYIKKVVDYIKKNLAKGYTEDSLRWALVKQGHSRTLVEKAINIAKKEMAETAPKLAPPVETKIEIIKKPEKRSFLARLFRRK
jgi:hypothetical protein